MSFASKHNKGGINWGIETKDFEFFSLKDLFEMAGEGPHKILGLFINSKNNSEYGPSAVAILEDKLINLPSHCIPEIQDILADPDDVDAIKASKVGFTIHTYESHKKTCYGINWADIA